METLKWDTEASIHHVESHGLRQVVACVIGERAGGRPKELKEMLGSRGYPAMKLPGFDEIIRSRGGFETFRDAVKRALRYNAHSALVETSVKPITPMKVDHHFGPHLSGLLLVQAPARTDLEYSPFNVFNRFFRNLGAHAAQMVPVVVTLPDSYTRGGRANPQFLDEQIEAHGVARLRSTKQGLAEDVGMLLDAFKNRSTRLFLESHREA